MGCDPDLLNGEIPDFRARSGARFRIPRRCGNRFISALPHWKTERWGIGRQHCDGMVYRPLKLRGYSLHVLDMVFSPDGARLATAGGVDFDSAMGKGGGVRLWDLATGQEVLNLAGPTDIVTHVAFSPDGRRLVSASVLGRDFLRLFMANTGSSELAIWDASAVIQSPQR